MALPPHLADLESRLASRFAEAIAEFRRAVEAQLRRESERWLGGLADVPAPAAADWLAASDVASLDLVPKQEAARDALARLAAALRALDFAGSQAEALDALLDGARGWADRVALVLARDQGLAGWGDRGFGEESLAGRELEWDTTLRERLLASRGCLRLDAEAAGEVLERFGVAAGGDAVVVPMVLRDRIAALVWADRAEGELELAPLQILVHAAGQRLELQALSDRAYSPTLWEGAEAPGEPLPLWTVLAPAPVAEASAEVAAQPPVEGAEEDLGAELWQAEEPASAEEPLAGSPAAAFAETTAELPAGAATYVEISEHAGAVGEVAPPESAAERDLAREPQPEFELESAAPLPDEAAEAALWEPAPADAAEAEPVAETAAFEALPAAPPAPGWEAEPEPAPAPAADIEAPREDLLGTVRMALPAFESLAAPAAETTAPYPVVEAAALPASPAGTQEIAAPPPDAAAEASEEATHLSLRRPPIPEVPASPPPPAPPTWSSAPPAAPSAEEHPMDRTGSRFGRSTEVAPPPDVSGPGLAFLAGRAGRSSSEPAHDEAKRLARLLISEIRLYNEEQVLEGRRNRDLYHRLREDIDRSRQIYDERVDAAVRNEVDYFQQELVRSLAGGDPRVLGI